MTTIIIQYCYYLFIYFLWNTATWAGHKWTSQIEHFIRGRCSIGGASFLFFATSTWYAQYLHLLCFLAGIIVCTPSQYRRSSKMDNDGLVLHITSFAVVPLCIIDGSPRTVAATPRVAGRRVVSALPRRIRLLTNSIRKCLWFSFFRCLSKSGWLKDVSLYSTYEFTRRISRQWRKMGTHVRRHRILGR